MSFDTIQALKNNIEEVEKKCSDRKKQIEKLQKEQKVETKLVKTWKKQLEELEKPK
jgi:peptidoglycan hydrolase CwlO-like protein